LYKKNISIGARRCASPASTGITRYIVLHGSDIHCYILFGDVDQVVGVGFPQLFYKRMVLAGLHNCYGKTKCFY